MSTTMIPFQIFRFKCPNLYLVHRRNWASSEYSHPSHRRHPLRCKYNDKTSSSSLLSTKKMKQGKKIFTINFAALLAEIVQWYELPQPLYKQYSISKKCMYKVVLQMTLEKEASPIKIYSKLHPNIAQATQDAAKKAIEKLLVKHNFDVGDLNFGSCVRQRNKRRILEIKFASEEISFNDLKRSFEVCSENINLKQYVEKLENGEILE